MEMIDSKFMTILIYILEKDREILEPSVPIIKHLLPPKTHNCFPQEHLCLI